MNTLEANNIKTGNSVGEMADIDILSKFQRQTSLPGAFSVPVESEQAPAFCLDALSSREADPPRLKMLCSPVRAVFE
ncbi:MAG TPA: hypothetical protein VJS63_12790 [Bradyrhizobium sp.]|nr:hypothetical protein [Bradyrhizobium sp.]